MAFIPPPSPLEADITAFIQAELKNGTYADITAEYIDNLNQIKLSKDHHDQIISDIQRLDQYPDDSTEFAVL